MKSLVSLDPEKSRRERDSNPVSAALEADALTTRPTRRCVCVNFLAVPQSVKQTSGLRSVSKFTYVLATADETCHRKMPHTIIAPLLAGKGDLQPSSDF